MGDSIVNTYFPHKIINKIYNKPTYATIYEVIQKIRTNASSVPSTLGGGAHGLLALTMSAPDYFALTGHNFIEPPHPGPPPQFPAGTTGVQ